MAVTIHQVPKAYNQSDSPIVWTFSSDQTGQANFSYIVETYVNSVMVSMDRVFPQSGIYAQFDASPIAKWAVTPVTLEPIAPSTDAQNYRSIYIIIRENYGTPPTNQASATSSTYKIWKSKLDFNEWVVTNTDNYVFTAATGSKWLSNTPVYYLRQGETLQATHIVNSAGATLTRTLRFFDAAGSGVGSPVQITPTTYDIMKFNLSYDYLEAQCTGNFDDVVRVRVDLSNFTPLSSEQLNILIDRTCGYETTRLHWLNKLGGIDSFTFKRLARENKTVERENYKTQQGRLVGTTYSFDTFYTGQNDYQTKSQRTIKATSGWVTPEIANWINDELFDSPLIWLEVQDTKVNYQKVSILGKAVQYSKQYTDTVVQIEVDIVLANDTSAVV
jgi:hypothetical protein